MPPIRIPRTAALLGPMFTAALVALAIGGCGGDANPPRRIALAECRLPNYASPAQCGELEVPEDRSKPDGRKIRIFAAILAANTLRPKPDPLLIIAGGPGQAASELAPFAARLNEVRRTRDVVLIDQRGTGRSSPLLCAAFKPRDDEGLETDPTPRARQCAEELRSAGIDAAQYTTTTWLADLEAMREALGYARWNAWGGSYGTRVALEYMRRHPDRLRAVILDGVAPPSMIISLDVWRTRQAVLSGIFNACADAPACRKAHPDPAATLARIETFLGPDGRDVDLVDPRTGVVTRQHLTYETVLAAIQPIIYAPELSSLLPELLTLAAQGDFSPLVASTLALTGNLAEQMNAALHYSVTCAEDAPRATAQRAARELAGLPTKGIAENVLAVCTVWPRGTMPPDFAQPVTSDTPTLIFSGGLDPVTPPANGALVARTLRNSRQIVAPGYGHIVSPAACGPRLIAAFVDQAGFDGLAPGCVAYFEQSTRPPTWAGRLEP